MQRNEPIAVIGSGCRFPGESTSPSKLWELLCQPRDLSARIPLNRFNPDGFYHPDGLHHGSSNVRDSYVLSEDHRHFDAQFFSIKPVEANSVDPQQRLLLETVYEAIESAGLKLEDMQGSATAVYVGVMGGDYSDLILRDLDTIPTYFATGTARSILSNRVSYFFDWRGPSMTIDTACSSSLVAVHQAVQTLREGSSRMAIAAGANLILGPENYIAESKLKMLSPNGRSRMWDIDADGYARGDGFAAIALKTLSAALEDGDHIECIIRETGINQDGRTKGITMPSATAQANLMCDTYKRAGLDLNKSSDRCQYFEAHGTGTPAGDPIEAEAISRAFQSPQSNTASEPENHGTLYVGSVKTIIGHTEGTAGLAGLLKVSLALKHGLIPPNLHLNRLNPSVAPFYNNLEIPTTLKAWPTVPEGCPRRASLNSFGFGGTNAHAILESYEPSLSLIPTKNIAKETVFMPFTFSASSESSLRASLEAYSAFLKANKTTNLRDLAWTLASRRSEFAVKASFSGLTVDSLCSKLDIKLRNTEIDIGTRTSSNSPSILGVFTGQGAQWAGMGRELILGSEVVRESIETLEGHLAELPTADRPAWSLKSELLATGPDSRLGEATIAQPLCTAIQIVLVDLLKSAGVSFSAVVGHSSGEIGAAYAAGYITAQHAICIAYYRGLHSQLASGPNGKKGAMMAVGTSVEDAKEICELPDFKGRISLAASNSATSVTLSGDADAIEEAKEIFDEEKKFARLLKVDKAYHSHHMLPCSDIYIASLRQCKIESRGPDNTGCTWFSSVYGGELPDSCDDLGDVYWNTNMLNPVLFSQAIDSAVESKGPFDIALEIGPHPALQGPVLQVIQQASGKSIPYCGILGRGKNDIEAVSEALGFVWGHFGGKVVDFNGYDSLLSSGAGFSLLKDLPSYSWDHDRIFWYESRASRAIRTREDPCHELLGVRTADGTEQELRWRNVLSVKEVPWLQGHQIQGETVFPAAGYIAMALESSESLMREREAITIEVQDLVIERPISFADETTGVETLFTLTDVKDEGKDVGTCTANFMCYSTLQNHKETGAMTLMATGRLEIVFGLPSALALPSRSAQSPNLVDVDTERFYSALNDLGYGYTGPFKGLSSLKRKMDVGTGLVANPYSTDPAKPLLVHPAMLDSAFQAIFLGYCWPGDGRLWSMHVPTKIERVRVNASLCRSVLRQEVQLPFDCVLSENSSFPLYGDVDIYTQDGQSSIIQIQGITAVPLSSAAPSDDCSIFSEITWDVASPNGLLVAQNDRATAEEIELATLCERVAHIYLKNLDETFPKDSRTSLKWNYQRLLDFASYTVSLVSTGKHQFAKKEWANDSYDEVMSLTKKFPDSLDLKLMLAVGENLPAAIRGETEILEHMTRDHMLDNYYVSALGLPQCTKYIAKMASQVVNRYPHMKILEIGGGTGGATKGILKELNQAFSSYTFTDISTGYFEKAQEVFKDYSGKMIFKGLDIEKDIVSQGYIEHSYDMVIASMVLHATVKLEDTMRNVRRLLKPGGYLLMLETTNNSPSRIGFAMGGLSGWWLGADDGRALSPCVSSAQWDSILRKTGFGGVDSITPEIDVLPCPLTVIASQAVDERVIALRKPLQSSLVIPESQDLLIIGGNKLSTSKLVADIAELLQGRYHRIIKIDSLESINLPDLPPMSTVLSLTDLDEPIFKSMTADKLEGLKNVFDQSRNVLWITTGCSGDDPYANMTVGFGRTLVLEMSHVRLQFLDVDQSVSVKAQTLAEMLLRLEVTDQWEREGTNDDLLWTTEPELALESQGLMIPRVHLSKAQNDRYNSSKRSMMKELDPKKSNIGITCSATSYSLQEWTMPKYAQPSYGINCVDIKVRYSLLSSIKIGTGGYLYLVLGSLLNTGKLVLALSETQTSIISTPQTWTISCSIDEDQMEQYLLLAGNNLLAQSILATIDSNGVIVMNEPADALASAVAQKAVEKNAHIVCTTKSVGKNSPWVSIHPRTSPRLVKNMLPKHISAFIDMSAGDHSEGLGSLIRDCLPLSCKIVKPSTIFGHSPIVLSDFPLDNLVEQLTDASTYAMTTISQKTCSINAEALILSSFPKPYSATNPLSIINWTDDISVSVNIEPVDSKPMFSKDKTYLLFGLTGGLGQSLTQWMVQHGARYIVVTSRNPNVDTRWLQDLENLGATVKIYQNDITDEKSVKALYDDVCKNFPPIAGVANGAMVLQDTPILNMTIENMEKVIAPKVDGSIYLDRLFPDNTLEFFVLFSSLACVLGNKGQSNYTAANTFMVSLAAQRRKRGLAASVINIGATVGNGYLTRERSQELQDYLRKVGFMWMSERDFQQVFAEGILAGRPESGQNHEVVSGLRVVNDDEEKTIWYSNPKFQHCILHQDVGEGEKERSKAHIPIKIELLSATDKEQVHDILKESFISKIQTTLLLSSDTVGMMEKGADDLGIDSLVAVSLRSWFLKELNIDMPVMKILGGASIGDLLSYAVEKLPEELTPNLESEESRANAELSSTKLEILDTQPVPSNTIIGSSSSSVSTSLDLEVSSEKGFQTLTSSSSLSNLSGKVNSVQHAFQRKLRMSFGQSRFWFLTSYLEDKTTFNITCSIQVKGPLRVAQFAIAVESVGQRHEALRSCFFNDDGQLPMQGILEKSLLHLEQKKIDETQVGIEFEKMKAHVFDLERGETMRMLLLSQSPTSHHLIIGYHHINMDGISLMVILSDLEKFYSARPLAPKVLQYPEFSEKQRECLNSGEWENEIKHWKKEFLEFPPTLPILPLSTVSTRRVLSNYDGHKTEVRVSSSLSQRVRETCRKYKATPFHFYLAVFRILLARFAEVEDLCIGVADAGRSDSGAFDSVGHYLNVLPLRSKYQGIQKFQDALKDAKVKVYAALANSNVPIDILMNELGVPRSTTHSPLFQAFIDYRNVPETQTFGDCKIEGQEYSVGRTAYDILLDVVDNSAGDSLFALIVQRDLYTSEHADILMKSFLNLVEAFSSDPSLGVEEPSLYSSVDIEHAIQLGLGPTVKSNWPKTLLHCVDAVAQNNRSLVAVKDGLGSSLTYEQMMTRINAIGGALLASNILQDPEPRVVVFQEPTVDWVCSVLAIMRLGATYVPLDLRTTLPRLASIVKDCRPRAVLAHGATIDQVPELGFDFATIINVSLLKASNTEFENSAKPGSPAVILYTSGSTGTPKGISLHHMGLRNQMEGFTNRWGIKSDKILQQSAFSFDMSLWQMFAALSNAGTVFVVPKASRGDPVALSKLIRDENITVTMAVPSEYTTWLRYGDVKMLQSSSWKLALSGGEPFSDKLTEELRTLGKSDLRAVNVYGPTEVTVSSNEIEVQYNNMEESKSPIPVGLTAPNYSIYIVDDKLNPVPAGVPGEILIGGPSIASGYVNDAALSSQRFIPNKFASSDWVSNGWTTMHRTGDRGRLRKNDGALMYEGRIVGDTQIKLRGLRIELRDVESTILAIADGALEDAVVSVRGDPQFLVAHVVFSSEYHATGEDRERFLAQLLSSLPLPQYMCPAMALPLESMPLNNHSKKDRLAIKALALPTRVEGQDVAAISDLSDTEAKLKDLWETVLTRDIAASHKISRESDFFHSGGNSMLLMTLQSKINQQFGASLSLIQLFESSTLRGMAACIESGSIRELAGAIIDWKQETELKPDTLAAPPYQRKTHPHEPKVVVLTGSTGFLGKAILRQLVENDSVQTIHCVAVRGEGRLSLFTSKKIVIHQGDLTLPRLGLSLEVSKAIFRDADTIIHNGADVSFLKTYPTLRAANLGSTMELINLGLQGARPQFHYISSAGVAQLTGKEAVDEISVATYPPPSDGSNGYSASKWASEVYLEKVSQHLGLPIWIHRPSSIIGDDAPELDIMHNLLYYSRKMKAVPDFSSWKGWFDFISVDSVASRVIDETLFGSSLDNHTVKYLHQSGEIEVPVAGFKGFLEAESKSKFETLSGQDWVSRAKDLGLHELVAAYIIYQGTATEPIVLPRMNRSGGS